LIQDMISDTLKERAEEIRMFSGYSQEILVVYNLELRGGETNA